MSNNEERKKAEIQAARDQEQLTKQQEQEALKNAVELSSKYPSLGDSSIGFSKKPEK